MKSSAAAAAGGGGSRMSTGYTTSETPNSSDDNNEVMMIPIGIQSIITQTDASGRAIRPASPTNSEESVASSGSRKQNRAGAGGVLQRWLCCFARVATPRGDANYTNSSADGGNASSKHASNKTGTTAASSSRSTASTTTAKSQIPIAPRGLPARRPMLGPSSQNKKCLVLDLDETLVHSSFQAVKGAHLTIPVNIDDTVHNVFVIKRPGVDEFMRRMGEHFEIVIYTASLSKYADPLLDKLDMHKVINKRLFRENCVFYEGHYVKDLSLLERDISQTIIVDNSPPSYTFHPENAIDCSSFIDDPTDTEMWQIGDFLVGIKDCEDVRECCRDWKTWCRQNPSTIPASFATASAP